MAIGYYWIDPNGGTKTDAIHVFCNFTSESAVESCVWPKMLRFDNKTLTRDHGAGWSWFVQDISRDSKVCAVLIYVQLFAFILDLILLMKCTQHRWFIVIECQRNTLV